MTSIQFLGATETVTGSKYIINASGKRILVDCGLFQGLKALRLKNWEAFAISPQEIDAIVLTHAHIDHSGYIPRFVKDGFRGKIFCTPGTFELCRILLPDAGHLMEEEADFLNRHKKSKHLPALPLFTLKEAEESLKYFSPVPFHQRMSFDSELQFYFQSAGHILGAASAVFSIGSKKIAFTGDVGRMNDPIFRAPEPLPQIDYLVTESTYGNRLHHNVDPLDELATVINETYDRNGVILIPAFAVGRAQSLLWALAQLKKEKRIPEFPMYLNSPMATDVGKVFCEFNQLHKLSDEQCGEIFNVVKYVKTVEESKALNEKSGPLLIISASGMLTGGRILHHLKVFAGDPRNTILLTGFQAAGTRGEALERGAKEIKIHGEYVPVKAQIKTLDNMSAHADYGELVKWFRDSKIQPRKVFITHGEPSAADELRRRLVENFSWTCVVPKEEEIFEF